MGLYDLEEERIIEWAKASGYRRLLLQAPDGIKARARELAGVLEVKGLEVVLSASHAWGGCDVALHEMQHLGCDALVHLGHHGPVRFKAPPNTLFVPARALIDVSGIVEKAASVLANEGIRRVGVTISTQHAHSLPKVKNVLRGQGIQVLTASSPNPYLQEGVIIGCDVRAAEQLNRSVEAFLVVAGGVFHALGVALATGVKTVAADPYTGSVCDVSREVRRLIALRLAHLSSSLEARDAVIVSSLKPGQWAGWKRLRELIRTLEGRGVKSKLLIFDDVSREALENYGGTDLYVNTACPRLAIDDRHLFPGPVVNAAELLEVVRKGLDAYNPKVALNAAW